MLVRGIFYAIHRIHQLGIRGLSIALRRRLRSKIWRLRMRNKALAGNAAHTWQSMSKIFFENFFETIKLDTSITSMLNDSLFKQYLPSQEALQQAADNARQHRFDLLGSGPVQLPHPSVIPVSSLTRDDPGSIHWHHEFKTSFLQGPFTKIDTSFSYAAYARTFHTDIPVPQRGNDFDTYHEDIKVLWDLGRMHHLSALGMNYTAQKPFDRAQGERCNDPQGCHPGRRLSVEALAKSEAGTQSYALTEQTHQFQNTTTTNTPISNFKNSLEQNLGPGFRLRQGFDGQATAGMTTENNPDHTIRLKSTTTFINDITSFQNQVSYLLGPHWKCPMDVAIRAINLIWALHLFKDDATIPLDFWQRYICMLYDHMMYLEWNFEESDKPNNHLLADYVGYLYLAALFRELPGGMKRFAWIKKTVREAFEHQILPDGSAYEGSTAYHRLDCELLLHTTGLLKTVETSPISSSPTPIGDPVLTSLENLLSKMLTFLDDVTDQGGNLVTIGDDDSGKIVFGVRAPFLPKQHLTKDVIPAKAGTQSYALSEPIDQYKRVPTTNTPTSYFENYLTKGLGPRLRGDDDVKNNPIIHTNTNITTYPNFGLGIMRTRNFHITLRTPRQLPSQPSGHFHHDALSITLNINGHPLFVDGGSFVYTANAQWRAFFKDARNHSTMYVGERENMLADIPDLQNRHPRAGGDPVLPIFSKNTEPGSRLPTSPRLRRTGDGRDDNVKKPSKPKINDLFQTTPLYTSGTLTQTPTSLHATAQQKNGALLERTVSLISGNIEIQDCVTVPKPITATWRFILHPSITIQQDAMGFVFSANDHIIAHLTSTLPLTVKEDAAFAAGYGQLQYTRALEAVVNSDKSNYFIKISS